MDVSVVVTCYNEEEYISDAIESVLKQTAFDAIKEVVIVNDGSSDNSEEVIGRYADAHSKFHYVYQENKGLPVARNTGIRDSTGAYIALLDGDDIWREDRLERQLTFVERHPDVGIVYSDSYLFNGEQRRVYARHYDYEDDDTLKRLFVRGGPIVPSTTLINRECFHSVGLFDPALRRAQDTDMWLRVAREFPIHHIRQPLIRRRVREGSLGFDNEKKLKYLLYVTEEAVERDPELQPLKSKRLARIHVGMARYYLRRERRSEAIQAAFQALACDLISPKVYMTLLFTLMPLPRTGRQAVLRMLRKMRTWVREAL